jgi:hypothetical protein
MSETTNPQPSEPPVGGSGTGNAPSEPEEIETAEEFSDPPTGGSGGGS